MTTSDYSFSSSPSAEIPYDVCSTPTGYLDIAQPSPIVRPPEDPPPDVCDELKDWLHAYSVLGIEELVLSSLGDPLALHSDFDDSPSCLTPTDSFEIDGLPFSGASEDLIHYSLASHTTFQAFRTMSLPPSQVANPEPHLESNITRSLRNTPSLNGDSDYATCASLHAVQPCTLDPVGEYNPQSEPQPPDPLCLSQ